MIAKTFTRLVSFFCFVSCADNSGISIDPGKQNKDLLITNSQRSGLRYVDTTGAIYAYLWVNSTISNNSTLPMHVLIDFTKGNTYGSGADISQAFLLPKKWVTPDKYLTEVSKQIELGMSNELKWFLDRVDKSSVSFDTVLKPKEKCNLTFGLLDHTKIDLPFNIGLTAPKVSSPTTTLGLSLDQPQGNHFVIPCGHVDFIIN